MNSLTFDFSTEKIRLSGFVCKRPYLLWIGLNQIKDDIEKNVICLANCPTSNWW